MSMRKDNIMETTVDNTLIFGTCYVERQHMLEEVRLWAQVLQLINPHHKIMLIDSNSPLNPLEFLADLGFTDDSSSQYFVHRFPDNVGHLSLHGRDGWGRAFCFGCEVAYASGYNYMVYIDGDIIFTHPVDPLVKKLDRSNVQVATPLDMTYQFAENGICFARTDYMHNSGFIQAYDWEHPDGQIPEVRCERLWHEDLFFLPVKGFRNDFDQINHGNVGMPNISYLTHCKDFSIYLHFLQTKGFQI